MPRVIFVDDDPDILDTIKRGLVHLFKYKVDTFTSPLKSLSDFEPGKYHFALLDVDMPEMDGFALARELIRRDRKLIIAFLSGVRNIEDRFAQEFPELTPDHLLTKPIGLTNLSDAIHKLLKL